MGRCFFFSFSLPSIVLTVTTLYDVGHWRGKKKKLTNTSLTSTGHHGTKICWLHVKNRECCFVFTQQYLFIYIFFFNYFTWISIVAYRWRFNPFLCRPWLLISEACECWPLLQRHLTERDEKLYDNSFFFLGYSCSECVTLISFLKPSSFPSLFSPSSSSSSASHSHRLYSHSQHPLLPPPLQYSLPSLPPPLLYHPFSFSSSVPLLSIPLFFFTLPSLLS